MSVNTEPPLQHALFDYGVLPVNDAIELQVITKSIRLHLKTAHDHLIEAGSELIKAKEKLPHGSWESWLSVEFEMSDRTAQNWMNVAREFKDKTEIISLFKPTALYALAAPSVTPEIRNAIVAKAESGEQVNVKAEIEKLKAEKAQALLELENTKKANQLIQKDNARIANLYTESINEQNALEESIEQKAEVLAEEKIAKKAQEFEQRFQIEVDKAIAENAQAIEDLQKTIVYQRNKLKELESPAEIAKLKADIAVEQQKLSLLQTQINAEQVNSDLQVFSKTAMQYAADLKFGLQVDKLGLQVDKSHELSLLTINCLLTAAHDLQAIVDAIHKMAIKKGETIDFEIVINEAA